MEITIDIKKEYIYLFSFIVIIFLIIGVNALDSKQPWHPIDQIVDSYGDPISDSGELSPFFSNTGNGLNVLNSVHTEDTQYSNDTFGIGDNTLRYKLFWEGAFNTTNPSDPNNNIRLCYYEYITHEKRFYSCGTIPKTCAPKSTNINYDSTNVSCNSYICNKICPKAIACYGNLVPEFNELGCDISNTTVNYNSGVCSIPLCKETYPNSGDYRCGCNCNLNSLTNYNQVYEDSYFKDNKMCMTFSKQT